MSEDREAAPHDARVKKPAFMGRLFHINLARLPGDPYGANSIAMHELTHAILDYVVGRSLRAHVSELFDKRTKEGRPFASTYAASNVQEYWAESTNAYISRHSERDFTWLAAHDPQMVAVLHEVFGPPIDSTPRP